MHTLNHLHKPSISVGIPTYEAGPSLVTALQSIYAQTAIDQLREIIVVVDGNTLSRKLLKQIKHPLLRVVEKKTRKGQSARLNDIFHEAKGELLVVTNDDVLLKKTAIEELSKAFQKTSADLLTGYAQPFAGRSFLERCLMVGYELNHVLIGQLKKDHYLSCNGRLFAASRRFYTKLSIPETLWNNDAYIYFFAKLHKFAYAHVPKAVVRFTSPKTMKEHLKQSAKFQESLRENQALFKQNLTSEYRVPKLAIFSAGLQVGLKKPLTTAGYVCVLVYSRLRPTHSTRHAVGFWETDRSTKHPARKVA